VSTLDPGQSPNTLRLEWSESGGPKVAEHYVNGFGLQLIRRSIERELRGTADLQFASAGLRWSMLIPWPDLTGSSL
jgi:two-component sensor histidine kinase